MDRTSAPGGTVACRSMSSGRAGSSPSAAYGEPEDWRDLTSQKSTAITTSITATTVEAAVKEIEEAKKAGVGSSAIQQQAIALGLAACTCQASCLMPVGGLGGAPT